MVSGWPNPELWKGRIANSETMRLERITFIVRSDQSYALAIAKRSSERNPNVRTLG